MSGKNISSEVILQAPSPTIAWQVHFCAQVGMRHVVSSMSGFRFRAAFAFGLSISDVHVHLS